MSQQKQGTKRSQTLAANTWHTKHKRVQPQVGEESLLRLGVYEARTMPFEDGELPFQIPADAWINVLSFLEYAEYLRLRAVCRALFRLCITESTLRLADTPIGITDTSAPHIQEYYRFLTHAQYRVGYRAEVNGYVGSFSRLTRLTVVLENANAFTPTNTTTTTRASRWLSNVRLSGMDSIQDRLTELSLVTQSYTRDACCCLYIAKKAKIKLTALRTLRIGVRLSGTDTYILREMLNESTEAKKFANTTLETLVVNNPNDAFCTAIWCASIPKLANLKHLHLMRFNTVYYNEWFDGNGDETGNTEERDDHDYFGFGMYSYTEDLLVHPALQQRLHTLVVSNPCRHRVSDGPRRRIDFGRMTAIHTIVVVCECECVFGDLANIAKDRPASAKLQRIVLMNTPETTEVRACLSQTGMRNFLTIEPFCNVYILPTNTTDQWFDTLNVLEARLANLTPLVF